MTELLSRERKGIFRLNLLGTNVMDAKSSHSVSTKNPSTLCHVQRWEVGKSKEMKTARKTDKCGYRKNSGRQ